ncbi:conjugal transfer protein TraC [Rhizobium sp. AAP43]|uniref:conjugal transfer protein TraC n=1 Tax=Rhizobium sp. AAP43 TaxID=1523420 RepID=UPI0006B9638E|nr:conjugal transfer protein TraC [Rhizobium sp. AAP43]KPF42632.1 conjugal transfer protein TraC [Rhizobium sp. AAP43]
MKKPTSKIREEIARLQEQLKQAETRDAERIGRLALRAGLGEIDLEETQLLASFEELAARFRGTAGKRADSGKGAKATTLSPGEAQGQVAES